MIPVKIKYHLFFLIFLCSVFNSATAQQYNFKNYGPKNGLAASIVNAIFQDSKGFIWFGTQGSGISRFNGKTFKNFSKTDGLISNDVTSITEDKLGNIWIGTSEGASEFDGIKFHNFSEKEGLSNNSIYSIYNDDKNNIWVATSGGGVSIYDNQSDGIFKKITSSNGLSSNIVYAISQDKKGDYWFAMKNGISKYDGTKFTNYDKIPVVGNKTFFSITCDHFGNLWFGSIHGDVIKYDGKHFEQLEIPKDVNQDFIGSIVEDKHNNIWFATNHGALKYDGKSFHLFNENENLSSNFVLSLYCDYEGNMWIGTQEGGVDVFNNESFVNYTDKNGLSSNKVEAVLKGDSGELIVGTQGSGLNIYDNEKFSEINSIPELKQTSVFSIMKNEQGIWVGTESSGIFILKETAGKFSVVKHLGQIENNALSAVVKILDDRNGGAWLATYGSGLFHVKKDNTTEVFNSKTGIASDNILTVFEDSKGNIWMGTYDKGVVKYDPENSEKGANKFTTYSEKDGLADKAIWSIAEDDLHTIYLGTGEGGISCFDGKNFKTISTADGLCSNYAEALKWDPFDKSFWIGTNKGINKIKISKDFKIESIRYYGEQEGFKGVEVNQNAIVIDKEGMVWFGTNNGLCRYDRNFDFPNTTAPKLRLNDIRMFYQPVDWKNFSDSVDLKNNLPYKLELSHKNNHLTFDFQAMTTDNVRYTYLLEGQDNDWSPLSSNNEANFTNIAPGKNYVFKVKAINSNGIWSKDTVTFVFTINPPWWQTWWFYTLSIVLIAAAVYSYIHYRTTQYAKEKKILEEKVEERTAELSLALQDIKDSINYAKKIQEAILPLDSEIKKILPQSFVLFKPRDIVSGDFYWFHKKDEQVYIAAVDCTGHGVPGAFMSMIGNSLLNEIVSKKGTLRASEILKKLHVGVRKALKQDKNTRESNDGMDLSLAVIDTAKNTLEYAGAKRPLFYCRKNNNDFLFEEIKADKQSIGGLQIEETFHFTDHVFEIKPGDTFYLFSDGYVDQFGGDKGKKFSTKRLKENLQEIQALPMLQQSEKLDHIIEQWKGNMEQIDDILIIGMRF